MIAEIKEVTEVIKTDVIITMTMEEAKLLVRFMGCIRPKDANLTEGRCTMSEIGSITNSIYRTLYYKGIR